MCRNIKTLHNFAPPATDDEIRASALQFVRKLCGFTRPSKANSRPSIAPWSRWRTRRTSCSPPWLPTLRRATARSRPPRPEPGRRTASAPRQAA